MASRRKLNRKPAYVWNGVTVPPGESREVDLHVSESYSGVSLPIRVVVRRGMEDGPSVFITAAIHGDELNGTGAVRALINDPELNLLRGTLILVPVVNILAFERHTRYLPDRRDLNRSFIGSMRGSLASRMARIIFDEIVARADYGIDLHTAAVQRTNFPNVRADVGSAPVRKLAEAFGCEVIVKSKGPEKSLRREACRAGCHTIILEAGEVWKVEPVIVEDAVRGVKNVLSWLEMIDDAPVPPAYRITLDTTRWIRAHNGGFLHFHVSPGDIVRKGDSLATNTSLTGQELNHLTAPHDSIVLGMTTMPAVSPGEPVCHLGRLTPEQMEIKEIRNRLPDDHLHSRVVDDLSRKVLVVSRRHQQPSSENEAAE